MRTRPSNNLAKKSDSDSKNKRKMKRSELKRKNLPYNSKESKKILRSNKMSSPKKLLKVVMISLNIRSLSMRPRQNLNC